VPAVVPPLTRRAALALGATGITVLTACDALSESTGGPAAPVVPDPDVALVTETVANITATATVAAERPELTAMHQAHLAALDAAPSETPTTTSTATTSTATADQVRRAEQALQAYLAGASLRAESGPLARLLASMSAAVSQQLVTLRREAR
jgi:hypothetical protein